MNKSLAISRSALLIGLTVAIYFVLPFPLIGMAAALLIPVPLILLGFVHGPKYLWLSFIGALTLIAMIFGPLSVFIYLPLGACSVALGWGLFKQFSLPKVMLLTWFAMGAAGIVDYTLGSYLAGTNPQEELTKWGNTALEYLDTNLVQSARENRMRIEGELEQVRSNTRSGIEEINSKRDELQSFSELEQKSIQLVEQARTIIQNPYPILGFWLMVFVVLEVMVARFFIHRFRFGQIPPIEFSRWKCPGVVSWLFLSLMLAHVFLQGGEILQSNHWIMVLSYTMHLIYFVFGLSFISFFMKRWNLSVPIRVALIFLSFLFMQVLVFIGIFDSLFNVRKNHVGGSERALE